MDFSEIIKSIAAAISAIAISLAYIQYIFVQKWKKSEFLANEMKMFFEKQYTSEVVKFFDYSGRRISFKNSEKEYIVHVHHNEKLRQLVASSNYILNYSLKNDYENRSKNEKDESIKEDVLLCDAMSLDVERIFTPGQQYVRDNLDNYFGHLSRLCVFRKNGLFKKEEFSPFINYHIELMAGRRAHSAGYQSELSAYLLKFGYDDLLELLNEYKKDNKSTRKNL